MDFGAAMFFTDYSMNPADLGRALEARGFESLWTPEHSHIPSSQRRHFRKAANSLEDTTTRWTRLSP
jgi:alkanesulfonate monooxygenase SsuD/methylene tetrahydromethanopterin reductase-like flavin-dependent oxidoreductase (luciferase family)